MGGKVIWLSIPAKGVPDLSGKLVAKIFEIVYEEAKEYLAKHYPKLLQEFGDELVQVWASFMMKLHAKIVYDKLLEELDSAEWYQELVQMITQNAS